MTFSPDGRDDAWWAERIRRHNIRVRRARARMRRGEVGWIEEHRWPVHKVIEHPKRAGPPPNPLPPMTEEQWRQSLRNARIVGPGERIPVTETDDRLTAMLADTLAALFGRPVDNETIQAAIIGARVRLGMETPMPAEIPAAPSSVLIAWCQRMLSAGATHQQLADALHEIGDQMRDYAENHEILNRLDRIQALHLADLIHERHGYKESLAYQATFEEDDA